MGQIIEFYVPFSFVYPRRKWMPESERGKVLNFTESRPRKSA
jgi:hypothetical protein